ncbi:MAG: phosphoribosylanthranilate isomerase [Lachnospiraceae bacterium]|nr:phosphoribosylanthranilate isomerase [Lachnospiraceae bacterium]
MPERKFKIKICGLTDVAEAEYLNKNKVDFAGVIMFYEKSRRNTNVETAEKIIKALSDEIKSVAVMVSPTLEQVRLAEQAGFDYVQIHGEVSDDIINEGYIPILKAFNIDDMDKYEEYSICPRIAGYVFDAHEPGSGKTFDWNLLKAMPRDGKLFMLAGGLNESNVSAAIQAVKPDGVDVSSSVEYADRTGKDLSKIESFVAKVRSCQ